MPKVDRPLKHTQLLSLIRSGCNELDNGSMWALVPGDPVQTKAKAADRMGIFPIGSSLASAARIRLEHFVDIGR